MKFYNYIKDININISDEEEDLNVKTFLSNDILKEAQIIIDDLNKTLRLSKNKNKFKLTTKKTPPKIKSIKEDKLFKKWFDANEKLTDIKKSFLTYLDHCQMK